MVSLARRVRTKACHKARSIYPNFKKVSQYNTIQYAELR